MRALMTVLCCSLVVAPTALAQSRGELLYTTHCIACHTTEMHWRDKRSASNWPSLKAQVRLWQDAASLAWADSDILDVAHYLNATIYHFEQTADQLSSSGAAIGESAVMVREHGMPKRILIIQAHPDASRPHLAHSLAAAYAQGAEGAGHTVRQVVLAKLDFPLLRSQQEWEECSVPASLKPAQDDIGWAQHIVFFFPLWLGDMPALLKGFLEQVARPGFAIIREKGGSPWGNKGLTGRSARVVVTMGMPALVYRWYFRAHSVKSLERNVLGFVGIAPVHATLIGLTGDMKPVDADKWLVKLERLGVRAE